MKGPVPQGAGPFCFVKRMDGTMTTMFPMIDMRPEAVQRRAQARARMRARRRVLCLTLVLLAILMLDALL